jgi:hypothetical protein
MLEELSGVDCCVYLLSEVEMFPGELLRKSFWILRLHPSDCLIGTVIGEHSANT